MRAIKVKIEAPPGRQPAAAVRGEKQAVGTLFHGVHWAPTVFFGNLRFGPIPLFPRLVIDVPAATKFGQKALAPKVVHRSDKVTHFEHIDHSAKVTPQPRGRPTGLMSFVAPREIRKYRGEHRKPVLGNPGSAPSGAVGTNL